MFWTKQTYSCPMSGFGQSYQANHQVLTHLPALPVSRLAPPATIFKIGNESIQRSHNLFEHLKSVWDMRTLDS